MSGEVILFESEHIFVHGDGVAAKHRKMRDEKGLSWYLTLAKTNPSVIILNYDRREFASGGTIHFALFTNGTSHRWIKFTNFPGVYNELVDRMQQSGFSPAPLRHDDEGLDLINSMAGNLLSTIESLGYTRETLLTPTAKSNSAEHNAKFKQFVLQPTFADAAEQAEATQQAPLARQFKQFATQGPSLRQLAGAVVVVGTAVATTVALRLSNRP